MTYGKVAARLRDHLTVLLERHQVQPRLGGRGQVALDVSRQIQSYRDALVVYCLEAIAAAAPGTGPGEPTFPLREPVLALRYRLLHALDKSPAGPLLPGLLARSPDYEHLGVWQSLGRDAVLGERELGVIAKEMTPERAAVVLKDTADLVRGLVVLDRRHELLPGWTGFVNRAGILTAAEAASAQHAGNPQGLSVDAAGWRQPPSVITGPALPGIAGALQAQHNVVVDLIHFPSARNLRHVLIAQADLAKRASVIAEQHAPELEHELRGRAELYRDLARAARTIGGEVGGGTYAAIESAHAARRIAAGPTAIEDVGAELKHLTHLNARIDARVTTAVEHGLRERLYFVAIQLPTIGKQTPGGIYRAAEKWIAVDSASQSALLTMVRERLAPGVPRPRGTTRGGLERRVFEMSLAAGTPARIPHSRGL